MSKCLTLVYSLSHLSEVCRVPQHVNVEKLGDIATPVSVVFFTECISDQRALPLNDRTLIGRGPR